MDKVDISDYVGANIVDPLSRVPGVGTIQVFGGKYAMRIWLDPNKLHTYQLSIPAVTAAIRAQNAKAAIGALGAAPPIVGQQINATSNDQTHRKSAICGKSGQVRVDLGGRAIMKKKKKNN